MVPYLDILKVKNSMSLQSYLQKKLKVGHHGEKTLESFCHWQHEEFGGARYLGSNHVPGGRDDPPPTDVAVLVTRYFFFLLFTFHCVHLCMKLLPFWERFLSFFLTCSLTFLHFTALMLSLCQHCAAFKGLEHVFLHTSLSPNIIQTLQ